MIARQYKRARRIVRPRWEKVRTKLPAQWVEALDDRKWAALDFPLKVVAPHSLVDPMNLAFLRKAAQRLNLVGTPGAFVECGVYRGGTAGVLANQAMKANRDLWLFDAFAGMPPAHEKDDQHARDIEGQFVGSEAQTRRILERIGIDPKLVHLEVGWFDDTYPKADTGPVALLHIDCDFYDPVKLTLETFWPRVVEGGYIVINDYGSFGGCRVATDEWLASIPEDVVPVALDMFVVFFQKPAAGGRWPSMPPIPQLG